MTRIPDRDETVERLLRQGVGVDAAGSSCPDASELAAWADAQLDPTSAAKLDAHIATCARCQSIVAAFVHSSGAPAAVLPFWRRPAVVLPVLSIGAAAAAVLAIAVWSRPGRTRVPAAPVTTVAESTPAPADVPAVRSVSPPAPPASLDKKTSAPAAAVRQAAPATTPPSASGLPVAPPPAAKASGVAPETAQGGDFTVDQRLKVPTARDPWQVINMAPGVVLSGANVGGSASGQQLTVNAFGSSGSVQWNLEGGNITDLGAVVVEFSFAPAPSALGSSGGGGFAGGRAGGGRAAAPRTVAADARPAPATRWRILGDGHVDRSMDAGVTWMRMSTDPALYFTAGAAPGPTTCWVAGRAGVVMVTTDNEHFTRVDLPERVDVRSLEAVTRDAVQVVTTTGVSFSTTDGGKTWQRREQPLLQVFPATPF